MGTEATRARILPMLSVIIPTRNREEALRRTLRSLREQTLDPAAYELLVVDDGSDPPVSHESKGGGPPIRVLRLRHGERSIARNRGASEASGQTLLFVDDDMLAGRNLVEAHAVAHVEWPGALVIGAIALPPASLRTPFGRFRRSIESSAVPVARGPVSRRNFASAANMSISRERFLALGGFDTSIVSSEDQDLALRHSAAGGTIVYLPEAAAIHDDSATSLRAYCRRAEWGAEHTAPFCRRHPDWPENRERRSVNGPVSWGADPPEQIARKIGKQLLGQGPLLALLLAFIDLMEASAPSSRTLVMLYRLALGTHLQRGFRKGWAATGRGTAKDEAAP